ncbi:MAG: hypothetical protein IPI79_06620 [Moraxellaceae bacterium]|nr:hypothetical protein [Moraxellaceae bacterium]
MTTKKNTAQNHQTELDRLQQRLIELESENTQLQQQLNAHQHQHATFEKTIIDLNIQLQ